MLLSIGVNLEKIHGLSRFNPVVAEQLCVTWVQQAPGASGWMRRSSPKPTGAYRGFFHLLGIFLG